MRNENYINIQGWMINDLQLSGNELIIYAIIFGFTQDEKNEYHGSMRYIAQTLQITKGSAHYILQKLIKKGYIEISTKDSKNGNKYRAVQKLNAQEKTAVQKLVRSRSKNGTQAVQKLVQINNNTNNNINNIAKNKNFCKKEQKKKQKKDPNQPMHLHDFLLWCKKSKQPHILFIADWAETIEVNYATRGQWEIFLKRNLRAAKDITNFDRKDIEKAYYQAMHDSNNGTKFKPTIETLIKYLIK